MGRDGGRGWWSVWRMVYEGGLSVVGGRWCKGYMGV